MCEDESFGVWTRHPYDAADYTASGSMVWSVDANDSFIYYVLFGKTMLISFRFGMTSIGGTPDTSLYFKIPNGKTAAHSMASPIWINQPGPITECGRAEALANDDRIKLTRALVVNWLPSTNNTYIFGQIMIQVL